MTRLQERLVDPPIVDMLRVDEHRGAFVVTFVPSDDLSAEPKLVVTIPAASAEGRQIRAWLSEFCKLLSCGTSLTRVVHSEGGDFLFGFADHTTKQLSEADITSEVTQRIYDGLQYVSQAAENAYRIVQVNLSRTA